MRRALTLQCRHWSPSDPPASTSWVLGWQVHIPTPSSILFHFECGKCAFLSMFRRFPSRGKDFRLSDKRAIFWSSPFSLHAWGSDYPEFYQSPKHTLQFSFLCVCTVTTIRVSIKLISLLMIMLIASAFSFNIPESDYINRWCHLISALTPLLSVVKRGLSSETMHSLMAGRMEDVQKLR